MWCLASKGLCYHLDLAELDGSNGFTLKALRVAIQPFRQHCGDVNGDGFDDLVVGARLADSMVSTLLVRAMWCLAEEGFAIALTAELNGSNGFAIRALMG